jgi:hypothetical protein
VTDINEINVELSEILQRYVNECCKSDSDGKIDGFGAGCCKRRGGVAVAVWCFRWLRSPACAHVASGFVAPEMSVAIGDGIQGSGCCCVVHSTKS